MPGGLSIRNAGNLPIFLMAETGAARTKLSMRMAPPPARGRICYASSAYLNAALLPGKAQLLDAGQALATRWPLESGAWSLEPGAERQHCQSRVHDRLQRVVEE